ncbi:hypothetical protein A2765_03865 [Candidatus Kaiserbacteria bacterium RIFCSPHIGHO2_01_FULL_56_24]|uniref:Homing endonuclease LAGLIDADG domain-containing protein n=1 Tax=Candidatus Kaiserbacteria bacterium RIFCSPHIGHO2_01_FULL_56_24 TaxID=1798487 RepID=A0A1F6DC21_9BACT|nr:MAG: hypothetical protein A2765_03865 [Candidatus Kaiserbacteria bacterium RIFCSPHIGHO2_01_FULL_56_24]
MMSRAKIVVPVDTLRVLYAKKNWSPRKIGARFGCDAVTIRSRLKEAGILLKTKSAAQTRYPKYDFSGTDTQRAYILGFRYGDLNVYRPQATSEILVVRCHSTHVAQEIVFTQIFKRYGKITFSRNARSTHMNCYLNMSFSFLLEKYNEREQKWLLVDRNRMRAFIAGYVDAEGTFGLNQGRGRFKIDSYDVAILQDVHQFLLGQGIRSKLRLILGKGITRWGQPWRSDLWRLTVNEAGSLEMLIHAILPYCIHSKRLRDAKIVLTNIRQRRIHGTIK